MICSTNPNVCISFVSSQSGYKILTFEISIVDGTKDVKTEITFMCYLQFILFFKLLNQEFKSQVHRLKIHKICFIGASFCGCCLIDGLCINLVMIFRTIDQYFTLLKCN